MFVLSAIVQSLMFGKERRLSIQFLVSLGLTVAGSVFLALLGGVGVNLSDPNMLSGPFTWLFGNAFFASFYLALPFIFMLALDYTCDAKTQIAASRLLCKRKGEKLRTIILIR